MITDIIFAQYKPAPGETRDLYTVPAGTSAKGTIWIAAEVGLDWVSVQLIPATIFGESVSQPTDGRDYILYNCYLSGNVPIYLQEIYLNEGDTIRIYSERGDSSFTYNGEHYT